MPRIKGATESRPDPHGKTGGSIDEGLSKSELALVTDKRATSLRHKQAHASGTRKDIFIPSDIDLIIESLPSTEWSRVRTILQGDSINLHELRRIFDAQAIELGWKTTADRDVQFSLNVLRSWVREQQMGSIAIQMQKDLAPYRGLPTRVILEKIVHDCYDQAEKIRRWLFESGAANVTDADLLKVYPRLQQAAIKGIESLQKINEHRLRKAGQIDGAKRMAFAIYDVVKGTKLEGVIQSVITDVVIEIESEEDLTPTG